MHWLTELSRRIRPPRRPAIGGRARRRMTAGGYRPRVESLEDRWLLTTTTTALTGMPNPSLGGQTVTFTATVTPTSGTGTPTGMVSFNEGSTQLGTGTVGSGGVATFSTGGLAVGMHSITATYGGDAKFSPSTSLPFVQTVNGAPTMTVVTGAPNPSNLSQAVTFTATVTPTSGTGTPTGTVTFLDGSTQLGTGTLGTGGMATFTTVSLTGGTHVITATYGGNAVFAGSTSGPFTQTVNRANTSTALVVMPNPSTFGAAVTLTATVTPTSTVTPTPGGTVTFMDGTTSLGMATVGAGGVATFSTTSLVVGTHPLSAVYGGDVNFNGSSSPTQNEVVNRATPTNTLVSSANPSTFGQTVTFTATVAGPSGVAAMPTGMVTFLDGTATLGTGNIGSNGTATFSTANLSVASHPISAVYGGDANYNGATSATVTQIVNKGLSSTVLTISPNPVPAGQTVTYAATVSPTPSTAPTPPTGMVTFVAEGGTVIGSAMLTPNRPVLNSSTAVLTSSVLPAGQHTVSAQYGGDGSFASSTSVPVALFVTHNTVTTLTSSATPSNPGQGVNFTAQITSSDTVSSSPTGTVTFLDGTTTLGTANVTGGTATFTTSSLSSGTHSITARYGGDNNFSPSTSTVFSQVVRPGPFFAVGGMPGHVIVLNAHDGTTVYDFLPFGSSYTGPVSVALGDVNGDGFEDLVVGAAVGAPHVKVYDGRALATGTFSNTNPDASLLTSFFAYGTQYGVGVNVAVGDVNGDGVADIITGASTGNPHVKAYSGLALKNGTFNANPEANVLASFFAYEINNDLGANVAAGDVAKTGVADIVTGASVGAPHVKVYNGMAIKNGTFSANPEANLMASFMAYGTNFGIGVNVAVGDVNGDGFADIITGATAGSSDVRTFSGQGIANGTFNGSNLSAIQLDQFFAYGASVSTGATVAAGDFEGTGRFDILTGATSGAPHYRVVRNSQSAAGDKPPALFEGVPSDLQGGIAVGV